MNKSIIAIIFIATVSTIVSSNFSWGKERWKGIIEVDAKGYYAYLPAVFIYQDLNFGFFDTIEKDKYYSEKLFYDYRKSYDNKTINKYFCGTALLELPFFGIAHLYAHNSKYIADGYSKPYSILINIAAIFYSCLGLFFITKTLQSFNIEDKTRALVILILFFGTNLFHYTIEEPGMSHVYSFFLASCFIYLIRKFIFKPDFTTLIYLGITLGLIVLTRPINGLIIFIIPFLFFQINFENTKAYLINKWRNIIIPFFIFIIIIAIQIGLYKLSTGDFWVYSYQNEGFNFSKPHIIDMLFSYRKGLFLYTPIYLVSLAGLLILWKKSKQHFLFGILFFGGITYVFSSWWIWYYGGSFSSRVYVEFIPFFGILLGLSLKHLNHPILKKGYISFLILLTLVCQIQTYQYRRMQIHWSDMNKQKYWDTFLRIDKLM